MRMTAKRRAAEAAAASAELAPDVASIRRRRRQLEGAIRTGEANAASWERDGFVVSAARVRSNVARFRAELDGLNA